MDRGVLDPNALTIARDACPPAGSRCDPDPNGSPRCSTTTRPLQIVIAGGPLADEEGKRLIAELASFAAQPEVRQRIVFLPDYDMALARALVTGVDVWSSTRPPVRSVRNQRHEGVTNGALNLSILDGWWNELYDGRTVVIPSADAAPCRRTNVTTSSGALLDLLEGVVVPRFYDRPDGLPSRVLAMVRHNFAVTGPQPRHPDGATTSTTLRRRRPGATPRLKHRRRPIWAGSSGWGTVTRSGGIRRPRGRWR